MSRKLAAYATILVVLEVPDEMDDQEALDEFYQNTAYNFEETENLGIDRTEFLDFESDSAYADEADTGEIDYGPEHDVLEAMRAQPIDQIRALELPELLALDKFDEFSDKELGELAPWDAEAIVIARFQ